MPVAVLGGWIVIGIAMYVPAAAIVAGLTVLVRTIRPEFRPSKTILRALNVALALAFWFCIPVLVHARFGRADH